VLSGRFFRQCPKKSRSGPGWLAAGRRVGDAWCVDVRCSGDDGVPRPNAEVSYAQAYALCHEFSNALDLIASRLRPRCSPTGEQPEMNRAKPAKVRAR